MVDTLVTQVELIISARDLKNLNKVFGISDPMCIVSEYKKGVWEVIAQTESKKNDLNPNWKAVTVPYYFEKTQKLRFQIRDSDKGKPKLEMACFETTMAKVVGAKNQVLEVPITDGGKDAVLILRTVSRLEEVS
jgi:hypothetical protein